MDERVLLVEDDPSIREVASLGLSQAGFRVTASANGRDGLIQFRNQSFDLVVLDIMLPDINGKEVCQRVRADDTLEQVKIICISGMVEQDKVADLRAAGADDFLQKPFTIDKLLDRCCDLLEMERAVLA